MVVWLCRMLVLGYTGYAGNTDYYLFSGLSGDGRKKKEGSSSRYGTYAKTGKGKGLTCDGGIHLHTLCGREST